MANGRTFFGGCLVALSGFLAGCGANQPASMVDALPAPNFGGPILNSPSLAPPRQPDTPTKADPAPRKPVAQVVAIAPPVVPAGVPRDWVPLAAPNPWRWIVIHHSATSVGGAARFGREHQAKGWDELGYHFVIGNGTDTGNGQVEVGTRWPKQKWGAHAKTPNEEFNNYGIGICLVGNFDQTRPSDAQMKSLGKLMSYLMRTYHIAPDHVIGHRDTKQTDCPGRNVNLAAVRRLIAQPLADASGNAPDEAPFPAEPTRTAMAGPGRELLVDKRVR